MMRRIILLALIFLAGCAAWQAGIDDPATQEAALKNAKFFHELGSATGYPLVGTVLGALVGVIMIPWLGRKKK